MITTGDKSGIEVSIYRTGGETFKEYDVKRTQAGLAQPSVSSCWLESEEDATFEIRIHLGTAVMRRNSPHDWTVMVFVEGRRVRNTAFQGRDRPHDYSVAQMRFMEEGQVYAGQSRFAALRTTDKDDEVTLSGGDLSNLGKIRIDLLRGEIGGHKPSTSASLVTPDVGVASEKGKKLGGGIGYTDKTPISLKNRGVIWTPYHDTHTKPYHRLEFNYRSRPVLQLLGVVEADKPVITSPASPVTRPTKVQACPSSKRKSKVIDIDEDQMDVKPDNKDIMSTRVSWLETKLQSAKNMLKRRKLTASKEIVDLTGND